MKALPGLSSRLLPLAALLPLLAVLAAFSLAPAAWVIFSSVQSDQGVTLQHFSDILASTFYRLALANSFTIALASSSIALLLALAGAAALARVEGRLRDLVTACLNTAGNLSGVPLAFAFIIVLGSNGALTLLLRKGGLAGFNLYSQGGLILVYGYFQLPLAVLLLYPAFAALRAEWAEAAALLGAVRLAYWRRIGLPLLAPAIAGAFMLLFANALGAYASAYALMTSNYNLVTIRIASLVAGDIFLEPNAAAALSVLLMALLALLLLFVAFVNRQLLQRGLQ
jgi:putative spermidine/putrescine transport system permease protein